MNRRRNAIIIAVAIAVVIAISLVASGSGKKPVEAHLAVVHAGSFKTKLPETGVVALPKVVTLPAGVAGTLESVLVHPGRARVERPSARRHPQRSDPHERRRCEGDGARRARQSAEHLRRKRRAARTESRGGIAGAGESGRRALAADASRERPRFGLAIGPRATAARRPKSSASAPMRRSRKPAPTCAKRSAPTMPTNTSTIRRGFRTISCCRRRRVTIKRRSPTIKPRANAVSSAARSRAKARCCAIACSPRKTP